MAETRGSIMGNKRALAIRVTMLHLVLSSFALDAIAQETGVVRQAQASLSDSVVQVHTSSTRPDIYLPWRRAPASRSGGSAVYSGDGVFVTNAHVVGFAEEVMLEHHSFPQRLAARVKHVDHAADLAIVHSDSAQSLDGLVAVEFADELPAIGDPVDAVGYAQGERIPSTTSGVVSRVSYASYFYGHNGFRIQVDAALNPGNSGGAAFVRGRVVGIAVARLTEGENVGYVIPSLEVDRFLTRAKGDVVVGPLRRGIDVEWQAVESAVMRRFLKLDAMENGPVITDPGTTAELLRYDVVLSVNDMPIDSQGHCELYGIRVPWTAAIDHLALDNELVSLEVIRGGNELAVRVPIVDKPRQLFAFDPDRVPDYFVYGPFVFVGATMDHVTLLQSPEWTSYLIRRESSLVVRRHDEVGFDSEQSVILGAPPFPHPSTDSYQGLGLGTQLLAVNDQPVRNLEHAFELLHKADAGFVVLEFSGHDLDRVVVLDAAEIDSITERVMRDHSIVERASAGLVAVESLR